MALPTALPAAAQSAQDLRCKGCVNSRDLKNNGVKSRDIKDGQVKNSDIDDDAVGLSKLTPDVRDDITLHRTYFETMDSNGAEATLVTEGPLRVFARCVLNDLGEDRVEIVFTSTVDGWFVDDFGGGSAVERIAGEEVIVENLISAPTGTPFYEVQAAGGAIAPDGSTIGPATLVAIGLNVFGHRCVVHGRGSAFAGVL